MYANMHVRTHIHAYVHIGHACSTDELLAELGMFLRTYVRTYAHTSPASPERLALRPEHVDHDDLVDVDSCVGVDLGHVRACVSSLSL